MSSTTDKPTSEVYRPELTRLPPLSWRRNIVRWFLKSFFWIVMRSLLKIKLMGRENFPREGPLLIVSNHLGDADVVVGLAVARVPFDLMGKIEF